MSSVKVLTSLILNQNFCSPKNIRMFLRTVREPSEFGRALDHFDFMKKCGITNHENGDMYVVGYYDLLKMQ